MLRSWRSSRSWVVTFGGRGGGLCKAFGTEKRTIFAAGSGVGGARGAGEVTFGGEGGGFQHGCCAPIWFSGPERYWGGWSSGLSSWY